MEYAAKLDTMASDIYRYMSFDKMDEYVEMAKNAIPVAQSQ